jgi:hypothetical protein
MKRYSEREKKIKFDPDDFPEGQVFFISVDGVNFTIREPRAKNLGSHWYDHKSHNAGISYEVTVDVHCSQILWINGLWPGKWCCKRYSFDINACFDISPPPLLHIGKF